MKFRIVKLKVENFKSIEHLEQELGETTIVSGANESGKSTVATAIAWCLTGKSIALEQQFTICPAGKEGEVNPSVTLECIADGRPLTLEKRLVAKRLKDGEFKGYDTVCFVNEFEMGLKKYTEYINKMVCDDRLLRILLMPKAFIEDPPKDMKELAWQAQRRMLISIIEGGSDELEDAQAESHWSDLIEQLKRYSSANEYLAVLKKKYSTAAKEASYSDSKIEGLEAALIKTSKTEAQIEREMLSIRTAVQKLKDDHAEEQRKQQEEYMESIKAQIDEKQAKADRLIEEYNRQVEAYNAAKEAAKAKVQKCKEVLDDCLKKIASYADALEKLKKSEVPEVCGQCGQKIQNAASAKARIKARIEKGSSMLMAEKEKAVELQSRFDAATRELSNYLMPTYPVAVKAIQNEILQIMRTAAETKQAADDEYEAKLAEFEQKTEALKQAYFAIQQNKEIKDKISAAEAEQEANNAALSEMQRMIDLCRDFISWRCARREDSINSLFEHITFKLFEQYKTTDEVKETCKILYNGIEYKDLSASTKIICALELVSAFSKRYNVSVPCILDDMESVNGEVDCGTQAVLMYVRAEECPVCGGSDSGRKGEDGLWTCKHCGNVWKKTINFEIKR